VRDGKELNAMRVDDMADAQVMRAATSSLMHGWRNKKGEEGKSLANAG
jgi:hypothetical protein